MKLLVSGKDHFELMWNLPKVIDPKDFPTDALSYFTFHPVAPESYQIKVAARSYADSMVFMEEVSSQIAGKEVYGFISELGNELTLGFSGLHFIAEYERKDDQWALRWFEDFNTREQPPAERRLEISSDFGKLKKYLS